MRVCSWRSTGQGLSCYVHEESCVGGIRFLLVHRLLAEHIRGLQMTKLEDGV